MQLFKAGESHGAHMVGILVGVPAGIRVDNNDIAHLLAERKNAYGRSVRQLSETDDFSVTGIIGGRTIGNNVSFVIENSVRTVASEECKADNLDNSDNSAVGETARKLPPLNNLRPGHADLPGVVKFGLKEARNVAEGASARNTCLDVAAGSVALSMLKELGVSVTAFVRSVGGVIDDAEYDFCDVENVGAPYFCGSEEFAENVKKVADDIRNLNDSVGGTVEIRVKGLKPGFGGYCAESRINGVIARDLTSIQTIKGVYFGTSPFDGLLGSEYADRVAFNKERRVLTSESGGIDVGMTNGAEMKIVVGVKPIPTIPKGVPSVDVHGNACVSAKERADVTAVFALCPILKSKIALSLCNAVMASLGGDNIADIKERYNKIG